MSLFKPRLKTGMVTALLSFTLLSHSEACTGIRLIATDGAVVYGRTLEFGIPLPTDVIIIPKHTPYKGTTQLNTQNGKKWETKYSIVGAAPYQYPDILDGLNSEGLAVGLFYFPGYAKYQDLTKENQKNAMAPWELGTFLLGNCANVEEVKKILSTIFVVSVVVPEMGMVPPVHYTVNDAQGNGLVIEYVNGELRTYDNPIGVMTNAPTFDWHMTNLNNYVNLSVNNASPIELGTVKVTGFGQGTGLLRIPGDFTPPSRFVRATFFSQATVPATTAEDTVFQLFHILNQFDIPKGAARGNVSGDNEKNVEYTNWTSANNLQEKKFYYRTYTNSTVKMINLNQVDLSGAKVMRAPLFRPDDQPSVGEVTLQ